MKELDTVGGEVGKSEGKKGSEICVATELEKKEKDREAMEGGRKGGREGRV